MKINWEVLKFLFGERPWIVTRGECVKGDVELQIAYGTGVIVDNLQPGSVVVTCPGGGGGGGLGPSAVYAGPGRRFSPGEGGEGGYVGRRHKNVPTN
jgi:hypothetical protein